MKIEHREVTVKNNYLDPVTYIPRHAKGNINHKDCILGVIINVTKEYVMVLNCKTRTVQAISPIDLVWG